MKKHPIVEAFKKGRRLLERFDGAYFNKLDGQPTAACHVGAIYYGLTGHGYPTPDDLSIGDCLAYEFPKLREKKNYERLCDCYPYYVDAFVGNFTILSWLIHYNDYHKFSTNEISKWLQESLEKV